MNWISILLIVLIAVGFFAAVRYSLKNGGCSCGKSGCNGCHNCNGCKNCCKKK